MTKPSSDSVPTPFVTFYSFKGGVGRSMALINVAGILAGRGFRVLVVDLDLEAPGLSYLVSERSQETGGPALPGFVELLTDAVVRQDEADLFRLSPGENVDKYSAPFELPSDILKLPGGELRIMQAGAGMAGPGEELAGTPYQKRLEELDLPGLYRDGVGQPLIATFKKVIQDAQRFDFVLVDSRTGFSDESGICTRDLADHIVVVSGLNHQNVTGTARFLTALRQATSGSKSVQFVLSPVPTGEDDLLDKRESEARRVFEAAWGQPVDLSVQLPYHPRLALTEEPHVFRRSRGYLYEAYVALERAFLKALKITAPVLAADADKALQAKDYARTLTKLQKLVRLEDGLTQLEALSGRWLSTAAKLEGTKKDTPPWWSEQAADPILSFLAQRQTVDSWISAQWAAFLNLKRRKTAEYFYRRLMAGSFASVATNIKQYAEFVWEVMADLARAEGLFDRALAADPNNPEILTSFAYVLGLNGKRERADTLLSRALELDPDNPVMRANYAQYLSSINSDEANRFFEMAISISPRNPSILGNFAVFLCNVRGEMYRAQQLFIHSLDIEPNNPNILGNFAHLRFLQRNTQAGRELLDRALVQNSEQPDLVCELWFYAYAYTWAERPEALARLKAVLLEGGRSKGWPFAKHVEHARGLGHPEPALLAALAEVAAGSAPIGTLEDFAAWTAIGSGPEAASS